MIKMTLALTMTALLIGLSNGAWAQQNTGDTATNARRTRGPVDHVGAERTGSASDDETVGNHHGYTGL
jgi:hypothetical protein